jgi:hypothetical protein
MLTTRKTAVADFFNSICQEQSFPIMTISAMLSVQPTSYLGRNGALGLACRDGERPHGSVTACRSQLAGNLNHMPCSCKMSATGNTRSPRRFISSRHPVKTTVFFPFRRILSSR